MRSFPAACLHRGQSAEMSLVVLEPTGMGQTRRSAAFCARVLAPRCQYRSQTAGAVYPGSRALPKDANTLAGLRPPALAPHTPVTDGSRTVCQDACEQEGGCLVPGHLGAPQACAVR